MSGLPHTGSARPGEHVSFVQLMARECPDLDELALSLAAEFRRVDVARATGALDVLASTLGEVAPEGPGEQCELCGRLLADVLRLRTSPEVSPDLLLLDEVLRRFRGGDLLVTLVYCEVARRAGIPLRPAGGGGRYFAAHAGSEPAIVIDPARSGRPAEPADLPSGLRWLCPHEVGFALVNDLCAAFEATGQLAHALTAARVAHELPVTGCYRSGVDARLAGLQARLN